MSERFKNLYVLTEIPHIFPAFVKLFTKRFRPGQHPWAGPVHPVGIDAEEIPVPYRINRPEAFPHRQATCRAETFGADNRFGIFGDNGFNTDIGCNNGQIGKNVRAAAK